MPASTKRPLTPEELARFTESLPLADKIAKFLFRRRQANETFDSIQSYVYEGLMDACRLWAGRLARKPDASWSGFVTYKAKAALANGRTREDTVTVAERAREHAGETITREHTVGETEEGESVIGLIAVVPDNTSAVDNLDEARTTATKIPRNVRWLLSEHASGTNKTDLFKQLRCAGGGGPELLASAYEGARRLAVGEVRKMPSLRANRRVRKRLHYRAERALAPDRLRERGRRSREGVRRRLAEDPKFRKRYLRLRARAQAKRRAEKTRARAANAGHALQSPGRCECGWVGKSESPRSHLQHVARVTSAASWAPRESSSTTPHEPTGRPGECSCGWIGKSFAHHKSKHKGREAPV